MDAKECIARTGRGGWCGWNLSMQNVEGVGVTREVGCSFLSTTHRRPPSMSLRYNSNRQTIQNTLPNPCAPSIDPPSCWHIDFDSPHSRQNRSRRRILANLQTFARVADPLDELCEIHLHRRELPVTCDGLCIARDRCKSVTANSDARLTGGQH